MTRNRTRLLAMAVAVLMLTGVVGPFAVAEAQEVSFVLAGFENRLEPAVLRYQELNPHVKIEMQVTDHDSYQQKLNIGVESNTLPDVFWWNGLYLQQTWAAKPEALLDLTPYVDEEFFGLVTEAGWNTYCRNPETGAIYAFPEATQVQGWLVNEDIFAKCGLALPVTTADLLAAAPVLKENGYIPIAFGTLDLPYNWMWEHLPSLWGYWEQADDLFTNGTLACEDADFVNVYPFLADLFEAGAFPEYNATVSWEECQALFNAEQAAVIMTVTDMVGQIVGVGTDSDISDRVRFIHAFEFADSPYNQKMAIINVPNGYGVGSAVGADPAKRDAIIDFFRWFYSDEDNLKEMVGKGTLVPTTMDTSSWPVPKALTDAVAIASSSEYEAVLSSAATFVQRWYGQGDFISAFYEKMHYIFFAGLCDGSITRDMIEARVKEGTALIAQFIADGATVNPNAE